MTTVHGLDKERHVTKNDSWVMFKQYIKEKHPEIDTDAALKPMTLRKDPVISYGIIEFYIGENSDGQACAYYHMFRRRNTIEYEILLRGFSHVNQLYNLISLLSRDERDRIIHYEWDDLWDDLWIDYDHPLYSSLRAQSKRKFLEIKELVTLLDDVLDCKITERPYIMPKGKSEPDETGWQTAIREAREETGHSYDKGCLYFNGPIVQHFVGSDSNPYTDCYFVWKTSGYYRPGEITLQNHKTSKSRLRNKSISAELESDVWIEIPIFSSDRERLEWINSVDSYRSFNVFARHFSALMEVHSHLSVKNL